jgi:PleD family two-component response regulator
MKISISIGLLVSGSWGVRPLEQMLRETDAALYAAKAAGRNCVRLAKPGQRAATAVDAIREPVVRGR